MKQPRRSFFQKFVFLLNSFFALLLLLAYLLPYISPKIFPTLSVLSLGMPILLGINIVFFIYWVISFRREFLLSFLVLALGMNHLLSLYRFSSKKTPPPPEALKLMSYNVRQFNRYCWIKDEAVYEKIRNFIQEESPDILSFQEYYQGEDIVFSNYPYAYVELKVQHSGQAIYSKFPIIYKGSLDFPNSANNTIYADIALKEDTIRVFNMHLESLKIDPTEGTFEAKTGKKLLTRIGVAFQKQEEQTASIIKAVEESPYKVLISGDMNNTAFSYVYRKLSSNLQDAYKQAGKGFGQTFMLDFIPLRIDMILVDPALNVKGFTNYSIRLSDHFPISAKIE